MSVLFVASEIYPLVKTGGLADVAGALPPALAREGVDIRLMMPAYPAALEQARNQRPGRRMGNPFGIGEVRLIEAEMPDSGLPLYLVDCPPLYDRKGGPYQREDGREWPDNHARFALLAQIAARVANKAEEGGDWHPDLLHLNDWQTGLAAAYIHYYGIMGVKTLYTIHNLRYQGRFDPNIMRVIALPERAYAMDGVEFHGSVSFMKAGIMFSDMISTVSRTYAREILTPEYGCGVEELLKMRSDDLHGIVNGIDYEIWNPARDPLIARNYDIETIDEKIENKRALQREMGLPEDDEAPLFGFVSRLTEQKGVDLVAENLMNMLEKGAQIVMLGTGEPIFERFLADISGHNERIAINIAYDEKIAHRIIAGSDIFLMPSRFEPCGLTQMYALHYGTLPIVRRTGGLNDTVRDIREGEGTGFVFNVPVTPSLMEAIDRAMEAYKDRKTWREMQKRAMATDFSWDHAAREYIELYTRCRGTSAFSRG